MNEYGKQNRENGYGNNCIACNVRTCAHHADSSDHCVLDRISVRSETADPSCPECTQCGSFERCSGSFNG